MIEDIYRFVQSQYEMSLRQPSYAHALGQQAFGAILFYASSHLDEGPELERYWEKMAPKFGF